MNNDPFRGPELPEPNQTYQTGSTQPSKSNRGPISVLLVIIIILLGAVTLLGAMNIKLFRQLNAETLDISLNSTTAPTEAQRPIITPTTGEDDTVQVATSPTAVANSPKEGGLSLQEIYLQTIVSISCQLPGGSSTGTGVVLTEDGYIVTNCHVVEGAYRIQILFQDDRVLDASLIGADSVSDLAVLQVEAENLAFAQLGDSATLQVGDAVVAIGDPLGTELRGTMTDGIISAINRDVNVDGRVMSLIQTNAALNSGNSGGPLINCYGQVIGINTMKLSSYRAQASVEGLGFAIPISSVKPIVDELIEKGYVSGRPAIGISGEQLPGAVRAYYRLPDGVYITYVSPVSDAYAKGIAPGDIVTAINGESVSDVDDLNAVKNQFAAGDTVILTVFTRGQYFDVEITLVDEALQ